MQALQLFAGPRARAQLRERGLRPDDVRAIPGAAGGPKGLALNPLDRYVFGHWLPTARDVTRPVHLLGASIGAWRLGCACLADPAAELARMAEGYIGEDYGHPDDADASDTPVRRPSAREVSRAFAQNLARQFGGREAEVLAHPRYRLHVFTSHGRHLLQRPRPWQTALGFAGAFAANALRRRALGGWVERVVFGDARDGHPLPLTDFPSRFVPLTAANLRPAILASCSIPFWLEAVHDIPGGPPGAYWDGGIIDYHLHLPYSAIDDGWVLYPHFQSHVVPGWLDKPWRRRHRATPFLDNLVLLAPHPDWVRTLPNAKLPDRNDFKAYGVDSAGRQRDWRRALSECQRLADDFDALARRGGVEALPLP
jgi:hypothetical protein